MNTGDKGLRSELMAPRIQTVEVELPKDPTVDTIVRAFRRILATPMVIGVTFEAKSPIQVKYLLRPGDPAFLERIAETYEPRDVLKNVSIQMVSKDMNPWEAVLRAQLYGEEQGFKVSHVFVHERSALRKLGRHSNETFLGGQIIETQHVGEGLVLLGMSVDSVCSLNDIQGIYGFYTPQGTVQAADGVETTTAPERR